MSLILKALKRPSDTRTFFRVIIGVNTGFVEEEALRLLRTNSSRPTFNKKKSIEFHNKLKEKSIIEVVNVSPE